MEETGFITVQIPTQLQVCGMLHFAEGKQAAELQHRDHIRLLGGNFFLILLEGLI